MMNKVKFYWERVKAGRLKEMARQVKWIYQYAGSHWFAMIIYTILGMATTVASLGSSLVSRDMVDIVTGRKTGELIQTFLLMIAINLGMTVLNQIFGYASGYISMKVDAEIKADIFEKILVTDWESLTNYHTGDLLTRWSSDSSNISNGVLNFIPNLVIYVFRFISTFAMVVYHDWTFAVFAFLGMPVSLILSKKLMSRMVNNNKRSAAMGAKMSGFNQEAFSNIQTIKAFDLIKSYIEKLKNLQKEYIGMRLEFQRMSMGTSFILSAASMAVSYAAYGWGVYRVWSGAISFGTMTMFLTLSGQLTGSLHNLTSLVPTAISLTTSAGRLMDIVEMPREDYGKVAEVDEFYKKNKNCGISLYLSDVKYTYSNGTNVFDGASLEAHPHEVIALVGPSGEGKTTMMRLILALITPHGGRAYLAGNDGSKEPREDEIELCASARKLFSYVPQGNTMFSGTIADNMRNVKPDASDEEIIEALKMACAWDFVEKLPDGIESGIKERGGGFSEGQAQRLAIARALLRKSPLLLLDEATSALDVATERRVLRNIMQDEYPRTCIVTTHRPTVLGICRRVYAIREKKCALLSDAEIDEMIRDF